MKKKIIDIRANSGFTMPDLIAALTIFALFTTIITTLMYSGFQANLRIKLSGNSLYYIMQILEDIDKISYDEVKNGMEEHYISKFSIPSGFTINIDVTNYNEGNDKEDLIKKVKATVSYNLSGTTENIVINRLKVKEL